jgi:hypothetical protein
MTDEGEPMTVKRQAEQGGNAMAAAMGNADDGELLATTENQGAAARSADEKPVDEKPAHGRLAQGMMPAAHREAGGQGQRAEGRIAMSDDVPLICDPRPRPRWIVKTDKTLTREQTARVQERWAAWIRSDGMHPLVLAA